MAHFHLSFMTSAPHEQKSGGGTSSHDVHHSAPLYPCALYISLCFSRTGRFYSGLPPFPPPLTRCLIFRPVRSENPERPPQRKPRRDRRCRCRVWLTLDLPEGALVPCLQSSCTYWRRSLPTPTFALVWSLAALGLSSRVLQSCSCLRPLPGNPVQHAMNCYSLFMLYCSVPTD